MIAFLGYQAVRSLLQTTFFYFFSPDWKIGWIHFHNDV